MIHRDLMIGKWIIDFLFAPDGYDTEEALTYLYDADASDYILKKAYHILEDNKPNTGFTFSNPDLKMAVVVIGPTTSGAEFIDTLIHELYHVAVAIAKNLGVELDSEWPAYAIGDSAKALTTSICLLGCSK